MDTYLLKVKVVRDKLLAVGVTVDDEELLHIAIKGLPKEHNAFKFAIRTKSTHLSFDELSTMLNAEEESLNEGIEVKDTIFAMAATANQKSMVVVIISLTIEEGVEETSTIEVTEVVDVPMVNLLNSVLSIMFNEIDLVLVVLDQKDQHAKSMESLDI